MNTSTTSIFTIEINPAPEVTRAERMVKMYEEKIEKLIKAGGKRWTKNGKDRIYLGDAITGESGMSRKNARALFETLERTYYDCHTDVLVYEKSAQPYVNARIESEFNRIVRGE